jgi:hypothetical protein
MWGLHRDGNIDRFLKPMSFMDCFVSHINVSRKTELVAYAIYGPNGKVGWVKPANKYQHDNKVTRYVAAIPKIDSKPVIILYWLA